MPKSSVSRKPRSATAVVSVALIQYAFGQNDERFYYFLRS